MTPLRKTARGVLLTVTAMLLGAGAAAASPRRGGVGTGADDRLPGRRQGVVHGRLRRPARAGSPRGQRHHGSAPRARAGRRGGTVKFWTTSSRAGCMLYLYGASGTTYLYIHLNNDLTDAQRQRAAVASPASRSRRGCAAARGSGPASRSASSATRATRTAIHPHLHFEVHPAAAPRQPLSRTCRQARRLLFAAKPGSLFTLALTGTVVSTARRGAEPEARPGALVAGRPEDQAGRHEGGCVGARDRFVREPARVSPTPRSNCSRRASPSRSGRRRRR